MMIVRQDISEQQYQRDGAIDEYEFGDSIGEPTGETRTVFFARCDGCEARLDDSATLNKAVAESDAKGWKWLAEDTMLCPDCVDAA